MGDLHLYLGAGFANVRDAAGGGGFGGGGGGFGVSLCNTVNFLKLMGREAVPNVGSVASAARACVVRNLPPMRWHIETSLHTVALTQPGAARILQQGGALRRHEGLPRGLGVGAGRHLPDGTDAGGGGGGGGRGGIPRHPGFPRRLVGQDRDAARDAWADPAIAPRCGHHPLPRIGGRA
jgi:hypothetical protein